MPEQASHRTAGGKVFHQNSPARYGDVAITVRFTPHPETEPARIREIQTRDVEHAVMMYGTLDLDELSSIVMLPRWNCARALDALGLVTMTVSCPKIGPRPKALSTKDRLIAAMRGGKWMTLGRLVKLTGAAPETVRATLSEHRKLFERDVRGSLPGKMKRFYRLRDDSNLHPASMV